MHSQKEFESFMQKGCSQEFNFSPPLLEVNSPNQLLHCAAHSTKHHFKKIKIQTFPFGSEFDTLLIL